MKNLFIFCSLIPILTFASFPIASEFQLNDTIILNGKIYIDVAVDSSSNYPIEKETLTEYRERLKKQNLHQENSNKSTRDVKKPVDWTKILIILLLLGAILSYILMKLFFDTMSSSSWW